MQRTLSVGIGPELDRPTWSWVGLNLLRELSRYFDLAVFRGSAIPECDVLVTIKEPPPEDLWERRPNCKVVYLPCDYYHSADQMRADARLPRCAAVVTHSEPLADAIRPFNPRVHVIEHDSKYVTPQWAPYRADGFVLWVGFSTYLSVLARWLEAHPLSRELVVLTERPNEVALPGRSVQLRWTPRIQFNLISQASAALDVKGGDFNQLNKPPEKLQTYIASGVPAACNPETPVAEYFRRHGFAIASPADEALWFSKAYHAECAAFGVKLREMMSLARIGEEFRRILLEAA